MNASHKAIPHLRFAPIMASRLLCKKSIKDTLFMLNLEHLLLMCNCKIPSYISIQLIDFEASLMNHLRFVNSIYNLEKFIAHFFQRKCMFIAFVFVRGKKLMHFSNFLIWYKSCNIICHLVYSTLIAFLQTVFTSFYNIIHAFVCGEIKGEKIDTLQ